MSSLYLRSPAKLNLSLKVVNKRDDGYHNLETLFERIDLCDDIYLTSNNSGQIKIVCDHPHVPKGPKNLVFKVARLLQQDCQIRQGVTVRIVKRIPVAAGLAGGSSNAATMLLGLNKLWKLKLKQEQLLEYAARLGSDISFFLYDCSWAIGTQRGEKIQSLSIKTKLWHFLIVPKVKVYSKDVFNRVNLRLTKHNTDVNILSRHLKENDIRQVCQLASNDLETAILTVRPGLSKLLKTLRSLDTPMAQFSGSGPALFSVVGTQKEAEKLKLLFERRYSQVFVVRTL